MTVSIAHNRLDSTEAVAIIRKPSTWDMLRDALLSLKAIDWTNEEIEHAARRPLRYDEWSLLSQAY